MDLNAATGIVLASQSPRRREILALAGIPYTVRPAEGEEHCAETAPELLTMALSKAKAEEVFEKEAAETEGPVTVLGADTVVAYGGEILGKPKSREDAFRMLRMLSGRTHQVYTGVTLIARDPEKGTRSRTFFEKTDVTFHELTDDEIWAYIDTEDPLDKAGAYGIQGIFGKHIRKIDGDYYNVVGLPIQRVYMELKTL
ncbi:MAG: septum formation protein Maf [Lachnospiraceae bacterium]|nr:septum formation protein Maf [Lachnospiraceae bacterium]